jgi:ketosteroid isomerase-like protein
MKYCPKCNANYTDETYEFCLQDGTLLVESSDAQSSPTVFLPEEQETQVKIKPTEQIQFFPPTQGQDWQSSQVTQIPPPIQNQNQPPQKSNTSRTVLLTALAMLLLFGTSFGVWYFLRGMAGDVAENRTPEIQNKQTATRTPSPKPTTATPTPTPEIDAEKIKAEIAGELEDWRTATEAGDINAVMNHYADSISFYGAQKSKATVRNDKQTAFNKYDSMEISISNKRISADASGEKAVAVFDKQWSFIGENVYEGKVQSEFKFVKSGGKWLITSEKDLKIYYVNK